MYKLLPIDPITEKVPEVIVRVSDGASIPMHPDNTDYQAYLKWLEEGNTPLPADEGVN